METLLSITKQCTVVLSLCILSVSYSSCQMAYEADVKYLEIDSVHNTPAMKQKFEQLKAQFLEVWLDTSSCYLDYNRNHLTPLKWESQEEVHIGNILHSPNYDTLLVLVTWYSYKYYEEHESAGDMTSSIGMGVVIDKYGNWDFDCSLGTFWLSYYGEDDNYRMDDGKNDIKRLILKGGYLDKHHQPDPTFWYRLRTDTRIFQTDREGNWDKAAALQRSKQEYQKLIDENPSSR